MSDNKPTGIFPSKKGNVHTSHSTTSVGGFVTTNSYRKNGELKTLHGSKDKAIKKAKEASDKDK